jgi:4-hydroxy-3-methylbut-2-enyl diphosphate reductase
MSERSELLLLAPLRTEAHALRRGRVTADVQVTGSGRRRSEQAASRMAQSVAGRRAVAVAGFCGAVGGDLGPGDLFVASIVRAVDGREIALPGAAMLAGELRRAGCTVATGTLQTVEHIVRGAARTAIHAGGAAAVDMESAWLLAAVPADLPVAVVRAVVDTAEHELVSARVVQNVRHASRSLRVAVPVLERWAAATRPRRVLLAAPRGFCAGVTRAIDVVERALARYGPPIYVRRQIIHNTHVVTELAGRGAVFVDELAEVPPGSRVVFAAHGVAPEVRDQAKARRLSTIDATCPLVAKVHAEVRRFAANGYQVLLIGHAEHEEVQGTTGEAPTAIVVLDDADAADSVVVADPGKVAYVTQTTLAVDEVADIVARLRARFPGLEGPARDDICYATQNRQDAAKALAGECDVVLVVGSPNSSNSNRLVEVVRREGCPAYLLDDDGELQLSWIAEAGTVGITAGASAPEDMVRRVVDSIGALGPIDVDEHAAVIEDVQFALPAEVR